MAKKAKSRVISVRVLSMAMTGFFYTFTRPRTSTPLSFLKYDPIVRRKVLFLEKKRSGK
ncbi:ribosomal protein L33 [Sporothrix schenckii ATCC 58251]|uniref:Large ribosomal subunit protein bL33m n=1 Tax=Sporothrix schenckii (strain ATCC 58251 / de Perez 2211183) TaxID=1391915 RepID=U7Q216_SPOS1|nr:ribosomal protein L33 [Sporothrix schenckii ATCC 58251]